MSIWLRPRRKLYFLLYFLEMRDVLPLQIGDSKSRIPSTAKTKRIDRETFGRTRGAMSVGCHRALWHGRGK